MANRHREKEWREWGRKGDGGGQRQRSKKERGDSGEEKERGVFTQRRGKPIGRGKDSHRGEGGSTHAERRGAIGRGRTHTERRKAIGRGDSHR